MTARATAARPWRSAARPNGGRELAGILLIDDSDRAPYNDKNSLTTDPHDANRAYAVWPRWTDLVPQTATATFRSETWLSRIDKAA